MVDKNLQNLSLSETLATASESFKKYEDDMNNLFAKLVEECPYETRLAITSWVFKHIVEHAKEPGSFRYLIYDRLGFDFDAYVPLYCAGGMTISNEFRLDENSTE